MLWALVPGLGFDVLEVGSRVIGEGVGEGNCRGLILRHGDGEWMDGWV